MAGAERRLAIYGTLAPGQVNHGVMAGMAGTWQAGAVRGHLSPDGWGAVHGCPGIRLDPAGEAVDVHLFESADLPAHWPRLDAFEGPGYRRVIAEVSTASGVLPASIYELVP
ncbi:MAG: gamma-glutamylcyclotransferase [Pseudomonadota bacterium]